MENFRHTHWQLHCTKKLQSVVNNMQETDAIHVLEPETRFLPLPASPVMSALHGAAAKLAELACPVLILGEPGSGKRGLALRIHQLSSRSDEPFRSTDGSQFSLSLAKTNGTNQLLGGAGMVYFTEAAQLSLPAQDKLLKVLARGRGGPRLVFASSDNLDHGVRTRQIGEDFYYAIGAVCLRVPPLRCRREDLEILCTHFLEQYTQMFSRPKPALSPEASTFFLSYRWPGNIAELEMAIKSLVAIGDERVVLAALRASSWSTGEKNGAGTASLKQASRAASQEAERELITDVLASTGWNRKQAAQRLQISYKALLYKLKQIGIEAATADHGEY